jgi:ABC-type antimicrobial peptide transport system permease subunit
LGAEIPNAERLETIAKGAAAARRFTTWLAAGFAVTALILASIGIYGMLSYLVAQRTRAGAQKNDVIRLTLKQAKWPTLIGIALGLAGAFGLTRLMRSLLFAVTATDPTTFVTCAVVLLVAALLPCWLPARRAASIDPMEALRYG